MFSVQTRWPARHPERIQLYSLNTPNGIKVALALEEMQLPYEPHLIDITKGDQFTDAYKSLNPNSKIPSIIDPDGPDGKAIGLMESVVILEYLAGKTGLFIPTHVHDKLTCRQWLVFQAAHIGPMFGQFGHFYRYAREQCDHPYPVERYKNETRRLLGILNTQLESQDYLLASGYSIVDMACVPWVECLGTFYKASDVLELPSYNAVMQWLQRCTERPAYQRARQVCAL